MEIIVKKLLDFFIQEFLEGSGEDFTKETPLIELGIIDSLSILKTSVFIQKEFNVNIDADDMIPENFDNIKNIAQLIETKMK